jgi:hypothetical protein
MAKQIYLEKFQYNYNGVVPLFVGDDWSLVGRLLEQAPGLPSSDTDLSGCGVTAFFPATGGLIAVSGTLTSPTTGRVTFNVPRAQTLQAMVGLGGITFYAEVSASGTGALQTYTLPNPDLLISQQAFTNG